LPVRRRGDGGAAPEGGLGRRGPGRGAVARRNRGSQDRRRQGDGELRGGAVRGGVVRSARVRRKGRPGALQGEGVRAQPGHRRSASPSPDAAIDPPLHPLRLIETQSPFTTETQSPRRPQRILLWGAVPKTSLCSLCPPCLCGDSSSVSLELYKAKESGRNRVVA